MPYEAFPNQERRNFIGCGRGVGLARFAKLCKPSHLAGVDIDPALIGIARGRLAGVDSAIDLVEGDARALPYRRLRIRRGRRFRDVLSHRSSRARAVGGRARVEAGRRLHSRDAHCPAAGASDCVATVSSGVDIREENKNALVREVTVPVRAHLVDGSTMLYPDGIRVVGTTIVPRRDVARIGPLNQTMMVSANPMPFDSIVGLESYQRRTNVPGTLVLSTLGVVGFTLGTALGLALVFGSYGEEMRAMRPGDSMLIDEAKVELVDERRGLLPHARSSSVTLEPGCSMSRSWETFMCPPLLLASLRWQPDLVKASGW